MIVYSFDVDDTLEGFNGPVSFESIIQLKQQGHIVGLCGNWKALRTYAPGYFGLFEFNNGEQGKSQFLSELKQHVVADDYVMVGNDPNLFGESRDLEAARVAGWRFIREQEFADGIR